MKPHNDRFIWDEKKHLSNIEKHGVSFIEAASAFYDDNAVYIDDITHSQEESRFVVIGKSDMMNMLMVCHCHRNGDSLIRLISARKANKKERVIYER